MVHVGIDIGTSNTVISTFDGNDVVARAIENEKLVPSAAYIEAVGGRTTVGREALDEWADPAFDPALSFRRWKLRMGEGAELGEVAVGGAHVKTAITPEKLTTWLVDYVVGQVADGVGGERIESVVVTVPHGWRREHPEKCLATRVAATEVVAHGEPLRVREVTLSEPVAAASYWLWEARRSDPAAVAEFVGKTVLVVDVGGGTFDLSLVRVGAVDEPLVVVDAINHDIAGDHVTALVMSKAIAEASEEHSTGLLDDPEGILRIIESGESAWARRWFLAAQRLVHKLSLGIAQAARRGRTALPQTEDFELPDSNESVRLRIGPEEFAQLLEPFYAAGRDLIGRFLRLQSAANLPFAVVFAGGGSRIAGVREHVVEPALAPFVPDVQSVVGRITMNDARIDEAVSLGAALVAAEVVTVEERVLYDIGVQMSIPSDLAAQLGLEAKKQEVVVSPLIPRGAKLPATADTSEIIGRLALPASTSLDLEVIVFDDPDDPHVQTWKTTRAAGGRIEGVSLVLAATTDGILNVQVKDEANGLIHALSGTTQRVRTGRATIEISSGGGSALALRIITPPQLAVAVERTRRGEAVK